MHDCGRADDVASDLFTLPWRGRRQRVSPGMKDVDRPPHIEAFPSRAGARWPRSGAPTAGRSRRRVDQAPRYVQGSARWLAARSGDWEAEAKIFGPVTSDADHRQCGSLRGHLRVCRRHPGVALRERCRAKFSGHRRRLAETPCSASEGRSTLPRCASDGQTWLEDHRAARSRAVSSASTVHVAGSITTLYSRRAYSTVIFSSRASRRTRAGSRV